MSVDTSNFDRVRGTSKLSEVQVIEFLRDIEAGHIALTPAERQDILYKAYLASNGWYMVIFDDCGEWDYIEFVVTPWGAALAYWDFQDGGLAQRYQPAEEVQRRAYHWGEP